MSEERRVASLEIVLTELGAIRELSSATKQTVEKLDIKVGIQNGRISKIERWQAFLQGCGVVIVLLILPIVVQFFSKALVFITH